MADTEIDIVERGRHLQRSLEHGVMGSSVLVGELADEIERLRGALDDIAKQRMSTEITDEEAESGSWIEGFDTCVETARAALPPKEPTP